MKFYYLGNFDSNGRSELINTDPPADTSVTALMTQINQLLPEGYKMHHLHPEWLMDNSIDITSACEITVTFVSEGAGYRNAIGYFIYPTAHPPATIGHIRECYFFFPNASFVGSGGSMSTGDRIKLPFTFNYSVVDGREIVTPNNYTFQNGHSIGFLIYPNGWTGTGVNQYGVPYTSISRHNPEKAPELKFHTACFVIPGTTRLLLSFEDLRRDTSGCDHDFNDAVMIIDTDITAVAKKFIDTEELENEKNDPDIPKNYTIGYKKIYSTVAGHTVEAVAKLYIPRTAQTKHKKQYKIRLMTNEAYIREIVVVPPKTNKATTTNYVSTQLTSGYSWFNNSFTYNVGSFVYETLDLELGTGIHFFRDFTEASEYDFSPTYKY
jgi:hypothetical protein